MRQNSSALKPCSRRLQFTIISPYLAKNVPKLCDAFALLVHVTRSPDTSISRINVRCGTLRDILVFLGDSPLFGALQEVNNIFERHVFYTQRPDTRACGRRH